MGIRAGRRGRPWGAATAAVDGWPPRYGSDVRPSSDAAARQTTPFPTFPSGGPVFPSDFPVASQSGSSGRPLALPVGSPLGNEWELGWSVTSAGSRSQITAGLLSSPKSGASVRCRAHQASARSVWQTAARATRRIVTLSRARARTPPRTRHRRRAAPPALQRARARARDLEGVVARSRTSAPSGAVKAVQEPWSGSSRSPVSSRRGGQVVGDPRDSPCATAELPVSTWRSGSSGWGAGGQSDSLWRKGGLPRFRPEKAGTGPFAGQVRGHGGASAGALAGGVAGPGSGAVMEIAPGSTMQPEALSMAPAAGAVKSRRFPCRSCDGGRAGVRARAVTGAVQMSRGRRDGCRARDVGRAVTGAVTGGTAIAHARVRRRRGRRGGASGRCEPANSTRVEVRAREIRGEPHRPP